MSLRAIRAELKRLSVQLGVGEEPALLIVLATARTDPENMDYPNFAGHHMAYRIQGQYETFHFPFSSMTSEQSEDMAMQLILHTIKTESLRRRAPAILDMKIFTEPGAWTVTHPATGTSVADHAADLYRKVIEARHEHTQSHCGPA